MSRITFPKIRAAGKRRELNVRKDRADSRDRYYEPALLPLRHSLDNRFGSPVLDQGQEGACTGFGLAAVIDLLNARRGQSAFSASPRMLYEMARKHDEWPGEDYSGSSCRGAIRGWKNMGVCSEQQWPYEPSAPGSLTVERAMAAREITLGAYYRLRPEINHYHSALNEVGAIFVSARVHPGWHNPRDTDASGLAMINPDSKLTGGHAFAIVGYDRRGFIVQNSWGERWGSGGYALWMYEDWLRNIKDGWVFRLAVPTPQIFGLSARKSDSADAEIGRAAPKRLEIAGHFVHFDDGSFKRNGDYWSTAEDVELTAARIRDHSRDKYDHLLIYAHGGLNSPKASATRCAALKAGFKRNRIYPFHIMYDTGLVEEFKDTVLRIFNGRRAQGFLSDIRDRLVERSDRMIEGLVRRPVTPIWEEMKRDARVPFEVDGRADPADGLKVIQSFAQALAGTGLKIHLAGHSTGAVLLGHLLEAMDTLAQPRLITSCSLMAPACSIDFYQQHYRPRLGSRRRRGAVTGLPALDIYNLNERLELDDNVALVYRKSLLYLVSNALERSDERPILGMQKFSKALPATAGLTLHYSTGRGGVSASTSHGGFDNDERTMNSIMTRILGGEPPKPFRADEMKGY